jgi:hypothetical protein
MVAAVAVNVIFWGIVNRDNDGVAIDQKDGRWIEFDDQGFVRFMVAAELKKEVQPSGGTYWFDLKKNRLGMFYEKMLLAPSDDPNALIKEALVNQKDCESFSNIENFALLKNCPYQRDEFDFIYFKQGNALVIVGVNTKYFSTKETELLIKSVVIYKK